jgi:hypothetical protein
MSEEIRKQINKVKNFGQFLNESKTKREKVFLNGYEYWLDREKQVLYDKEESTNGIHYDTDGISIWSSHLTKNERQQLLDYIKYGR